MLMIQSSSYNSFPFQYYQMTHYYIFVYYYQLIPLIHLHLLHFLLLYHKIHLLYHQLCPFTFVLYLYIGLIDLFRISYGCYIYLTLIYMFLLIKPNIMPINNISKQLINFQIQSLISMY